ncbi:MAG: hypothetical protein ACLTE9_06115 [Thomasclavelia ramosa]
MLKIEKIKEEILNFNHANDALRCYLARVTTKQSNIDGCCRPNLRCEECLKVSFIDLLEEYKKPVKLTKFEYEYLKVAKKEGVNFIARDKINVLYGFEKRPKKRDLMWGSGGDCVRMFESIFKFVQWENEEPWNIDNILANCEVIENEKR